MAYAWNEYAVDAIHVPHAQYVARFNGLNEAEYEFISTEDNYDGNVPKQKGRYR